MNDGLKERAVNLFWRSCEWPKQREDYLSMGSSQFLSRDLMNITETFNCETKSPDRKQC